MGVIRLQSFGGVIPMAGHRTLPEGFATEALNTWLYSSELRGARPPTNLQAINNTTKKVFRIPLRTVGGDPANPTVIPPPSYLGNSVWNQYLDPDTDIVRGPLVNDAYDRFYYCSPSTGPMYNTLARLQTGEPGYKLGVPKPTTAPGGSVSGGVAVNNTTRAYVYTWVTQYGEESQPSPPLLLAGKADGTWAITGLADPGAGVFTGRANYLKKYLYRTITSASGVATYFRIGEVATGTTTYSDTMADTVLAGNLQLNSTDWAMPPETLKGIIAMPNGFLIGWDKDDIYFSEAYQPHAWPVELIVSTEFPVVGLGVFGTTCVVCTEGFPSTLSGTKPASMSFTKSTSAEPCLSRGSIVSTPNGVFYASQNGLMLVGPGGFDNITKTLISSELWNKNYSPQYLRAVQYQNGYLALRAIPSTTARSGFFIDPSDAKVALTEYDQWDTAVNLQTDIWSGKVLLLMDDQVKLWDPPTEDLYPARWRSKEYQLPYETNFGAYMIFWDDARYATNSIGTDLIGATSKVRFRVWADRVLVYDQIVPRNGDPVRLPSGFKAAIWQFEITCRAPVYSAHVATSLKELRSA
jgi:hypothetical protein